MSLWSASIHSKFWDATNTAMRVVSLRAIAGLKMTLAKVLSSAWQMSMA